MICYPLWNATGGVFKLCCGRAITRIEHETQAGARDGNTEEISEENSESAIDGYMKMKKWNKEDEYNIKSLLTVEEEGIVFLSTPYKPLHGLNEVIPRR